MARLSGRLGNMFKWMRKDVGGGPVSLGGEAEADGANSATAVMDAPADAAVVRRGEKAGRESAIAKLEHGYSEVVDLLQSVRTHMETQSDRSERLVQIMEGLPDALKSLPEASRNQARLLETIEQQIERQSQNSHKLTGALEGLARSTEHHDRSLGAIHEHLASSQQTGEQMLGSMQNLNGTLGSLGDANAASAEMLRDLADRTRRSDDHVRDLFQRNQKHMTLMSVVSWSLAIVALTVAGYVAVSVSQLSSPTPDAAAPASQPQPIDEPAGTLSDNPSPFDVSAGISLEADGVTPLPPGLGLTDEQALNFVPSSLLETGIQSPVLPTDQPVAQADEE